MGKRLFPIEKLIDRLKENYFQNFDSTNSIESKEVTILNISKASGDICRYFSLVLLSGDYCLSTYEELKSEIRILEYFLEEKSQELESVNLPEDQPEIQNIFINNLFDVIKNGIKPRYLNFLRDLQNQLNLKKVRKLVQAYKVIDQSLNDEYTELNFDLFYRILIVTSIEHFEYNFDHNVIKNLVLQRKEIESLEFDVEDPLKNAILEKTNFLIKKLLLRLQTPEGDKESPELLYSFDSDEDEYLESERIIISERFSPWEEIIKSHYDLDSDSKRFQEKRTNKVYTKINDRLDLKLSDYHVLTKTYKDVLGNQERLANLYETFKSTCVTSLSFNKYAYSIDKTYLFNNKMSLHLDKTKEIDFDNVFSAIEYSQMENSNTNYFPWQKLASYLASKMDDLSENLIDLKSYEEFESLLNKYKKVLDKLNKTWNWSILRNYCPFQSIFSECKSEYIFKCNEYNSSVNLFIFSSYVLPLNFKLIKSKNIELNNKKLKYETLLLIYRKLNRVVDIVNESSDLVKKHDKRSVEILAIFSAVALFSIGSLQIFNSEVISKDPHLFYKLTLSFGYSLATFVLLIWIITRDNIKKIGLIHWLLILIFALSSFFINKAVSNDFFLLSNEINETETFVE